MALPVYSSKDVFVAFGGRPLDGLAPDSFVTFSRSEDHTDEEVGSDGQLSVSISPNQSGTCTITLQQQSIANNILAAIIGQQDANRQLVIGDITITNPGGSTLAVMSNCHIKTSPETDFGNTATGKNRSWVFFCEKMLFSGSPSGSALFGANLNFVNANTF